MQTICDFVHNHIRFDYMKARSTRTAFEAYHERVGVCRDFAHLAAAFCRCLNIPTRYVNGHLGDIGVPIVDPMDSAPGSKFCWMANGIHSIRVTTRHGSAGSSLHAAAARRTSR